MRNLCCEQNMSSSAIYVICLICVDMFSTLKAPVSAKNLNSRKNYIWMCISKCIILLQILISWETPSSLTKQRPNFLTIRTIVTYSHAKRRKHPVVETFWRADAFFKVRGITRKGAETVFQPVSQEVNSLVLK